MVGKVKTAVLSLLSSQEVTVEVKTQNGLPRFSIIGLADSAVRESRDRVLAALSCCNVSLPDQILVSLAPAEVRKEGSGVDVPIALAILVAAGIIPQEAVQGYVFLGELGLNGEIRRVRGVITHAALAASRGATGIVVPTDNYREASLLPGIRVIPADSLAQLIAWLLGDDTFVYDEPSHAPDDISQRASVTFDSIVGQETAKQALIVAAAGGHNALLVGPPGCGKTMLAEAFRSLLPALTKEEMLAVASIHSIAGLSVAQILNGVRPFRAPHYGMSESALIGGGGLSMRPGEASLAHCGVLFLDELPEFRRDVIEALRVPLEAGVLHIARARSSVVIPSRFQLIAAMNPCPCGRIGSKGQGCRCAPHAVQQYLKKLSLPILDRIDLHITLKPVPIEELSPSKDASGGGVSHETLHSLITATRCRQIERQGMLNSELNGAEALGLVESNSEASKLMSRISEAYRISVRGYTRILKVARTIADLRDSHEIEAQDVAAAFGYRNTQIFDGMMQSVAPAL